jgi:hypothetical protein
MKTPNSKVLIFNLILLLTILSCSENRPDQDQQQIEEPGGSNIILASTRDIFKTLPSPVETAELIVQTDVKFDYKILNPLHNIPFYETSQSMALNLGIYCADLSFICLYDQKQLSFEYLGAVKALSDGLGLVHLLSQNDIIMLEENLFNKDSIKMLVEELFFNSGEFLNDNNRPEIALMVVVGGWIEGLYIAMQMARQSGRINKELVDRLVEQYESLLLVIKSLENFSNLPQIKGVLADMLRLKAIYDKMLLPQENSEKVTNLSGKPNVQVTPDLFLSLYHEIIKIRNSYTQ